MEFVYLLIAFAAGVLCGMIILSLLTMSKIQELYEEVERFKKNDEKFDRRSNRYSGESSEL